MRKQWALGILIGIFIFGTAFIGFKLSRPNQAVRFPGEFEKQQAVWMQWPSEVYNWGPRPVNPVMLDIIKKLARFIRVNLLVRNVDEVARVKTLFAKNRGNTANLHFYIMSHFTIWARDVGPIFLKIGNGRLRIADFGFNNYSRGGDPRYIGIEAKIDAGLAKTLRIPLVHSPLISEGGAIESNGQGVLMVTEAVARKRNPGLSKDQIAKEYSRVLGVSKVIWLPKGLAEDDQITTGHINEFARFVSPNTIFLGQVLPGDRNRNRYTRESYRRLEENFRILSRATDLKGRAFRIRRIPMPPTVYAAPDYTGGIPIRSYLNFVITNGAVLMQTYWTSGRSAALKATEEQLKRLFRKEFPGRQIIGINTEAVNEWGGGIHCITQPMPAQ